MPKIGNIRKSALKVSAETKRHVQPETKNSAKKIVNGIFAQSIFTD